MVEVAESLFYHSRPTHIAPLHPRSCFGGADNSLSLSEGGESQGSPGSSQRQGRLVSRRRKSGRRGRGAGAGVNGNIGRKGKPIDEGLPVGLGFPATKRSGRGEREGWRSPPVSEEGWGGRITGRASSRVAPGGDSGSPENRKTRPRGGDREGVGDGAVAAGRQVISRGDVTYAATTLRLRRARGEAGPIEVGQNR